MSVLSKARDIAQGVREWTERRREAPDDLCGYCAIAAAELHKRLNAAGIDALLHVAMHSNESDAHVFVTVDDHIVDVTATQFSQFAHDPVVILHEKEAQHWFHTSYESFDTVAELRRHQVKTGWPQNQIARR